MELHPYDGVERRFRDTDPDQALGLEALLQVLGLSQPALPGPVRYDLTFYSGGIGVLDQLAAALPEDSNLWMELVAQHDARDPDGLELDAENGEPFRWLVAGDTESQDIRTAAAAFVNSERAEFQKPCAASNVLVFAAQSDVNGWVALWRADGEINFLAFSQG